MQPIIEQFQDIWNRLTNVQRVSLVGVGLATVVSLIYLSAWVNEPEYTVLFADLDPEGAGQIVAQLKDQNIPYQLEKNGTAILVPSESVYELRLQLAGQGLPGKDGIGYEIFDNTNLGMSDFVQRLNYRRALEGELARTIQSLHEIQMARVHIVIPEHRLFSEDQQQPSASVFVKLAPGRQVTKPQIQGITYLVASSVEGMTPESISIIDAHGQLLSEETKEDSFLGLSSNQLETQKNVENHLTRKAQAMLDGVLGPNNAIVRVHTTLNFEQVERSIEEYDPETPSIRSQERSQTDVAGTEIAPGQTTGSNSITNYELNKRVEHVIGNVGNITRLSVAVIVNEARNADGSAPEPAELEALKKLVQNTVGFSNERLDQIEISTFPFDTSAADRERAVFEDVERQNFIMSLIQKGIIGALVIGVLLFGRSLMKRAKPLFPDPTPAPVTANFTELQQDGTMHLNDNEDAALPEAEPEELEELPIEVDDTDLRKDRLLGYVTKEPEKAAALVRTWLLEK